MLDLTLVNRKVKKMPEREFNISKLGEVLKEKFPQIAFAYLFGSSSDGIIDSGSDVDIAVFHSFQDAFELVRVAGIIEHLVSWHDVDIVDLKKANPVLVHEAMHGQLLFVRPEAEEVFQDFYVRHCRAYEETIYWMRKQLEYRGYEVQWDN